MSQPAPDAFAALDFETANSSRDSACAVAVVRAEGGRIVARERRLVRPPSESFEFTWVHGITWKDVAKEPAFAEVWPQVAPLLEGVAFIGAHNAPFDRSVLAACCALAGLEPPAAPFRCSVRLAREVWNIYPTTLPHVCTRLGIPLRHHDALSDAEACARIFLAADEARARVRRWR